VWTSPREAVSADEVAGYSVAPGDSVLPMIFVTHRHPEFWSEPERFDPERFTPGLVAERHPCAYLPFGAGPRLCLGMNFALQEMILLVASVAQRVRMSLSPGQQLIIDTSAATLRLRDHLHVRVERRA
jgi:cytochrome P450